MSPLRIKKTEFPRLRQASIRAEQSSTAGGHLMSGRFSGSEKREAERDKKEQDDPFIRAPFNH